MSDKILLDTNLWIYLYSKDPIDKYERVNALFLSHIESLIVIRNPLKHDQHVCMHAQQYTLAERSRSRSVAAGVSHNPPDTLLCEKAKPTTTLRVRLSHPHSAILRN